jgi:simple sugar transport system ATP-binding protein
LRDGEVVKSVETSKISLRDIAKLMVGRDLGTSTIEGKDRKIEEDYILEMKDLNVDMLGEKVKGIDLNVRKGEILGIGGLAGQGKIGIANGIMGLYGTKGSIIKNGKDMPLNNPRETLNSSIAFLSEDRRNVGLLLDESIELNMTVTGIEIKSKFIKSIGPLKLINRKEIRNHALDMIKKLDIRCTSSRQLVRNLSGGNQQKVCIARALTLEPDLLLVSEPTRGIDVGAKKLVLDTLIKLNRDFNMTIIITSSELGELRLISDRIAIIYGGKLKGILSPDAPDEEFGLLMAGESIEKVVD